jgi:2-hydroxycyclohexanecarboxyl-CoA dehydrogenase
MKGLSGKVALVTGAARGIGFAIAMRLAEEGARVAIADVNDHGAVEAAARIGKATMGIRIDVTDTVSIAAGVAAVVERLGPIDVLVNNAGWDKVEPFVKSEEATWDTVIAINLKGPIACGRAPCLTP